MTDHVDNVVALENRKLSWTPEETLAVAGRRTNVKQLIVVLEHDDGSIATLTSGMCRKDLLWLATQAHQAALQS